ncbi:hypothetical protein EBR96_08705, partial [bacterium]|nr:hypothetical protein [bacterium]
ISTEKIKNSIPTGSEISVAYKAIVDEYETQNPPLSSLPPTQWAWIQPPITSIRIDGLRVSELSRPYQALLIWNLTNGRLASRYGLETVQNASVTVTIPSRQEVPVSVDSLREWIITQCGYYGSQASLDVSRRSPNFPFAQLCSATKAIQSAFGYASQVLVTGIGERFRHMVLFSSCPMRVVDSNYRSSNYGSLDALKWHYAVVDKIVEMLYQEAAEQVKFEPAGTSPIEIVYLVNGVRVKDDE